MKPLLLLVVAWLLTACHQMPPAGSRDQHSQELEGWADSSQLALLQTAAAAQPDDPKTQFALAAAYAEAALARDAQALDSTQSRALALQYFERVLVLAPGNIVTLNAIYNLHYRHTLTAGESAYQAAKSSFEQLSPDMQRHSRPPALALFVYFYLQQTAAGHKDYAKLQQLLLQAIGEQPQSDTSYIQLAALYRQQGYSPLALATLKEASTAIPLSAELVRAIAKTYEDRAQAQGCSYEQGEALRDALGYYKQAVALDTDHAQTHFNLAQLYLDQNQPQLALNEAQILYELDAKPENMAFIAEQYALMGQDARALTILAQAQQLGLAESDAGQHEIYMYTGQWQRAAEAFSHYLTARESLSVYDLIKADIINHQSGANFDQAFSGRQVQSHSTWESAIYAFWMRQLSKEQLQTLARNRCERTEFYFYTGYRALLAGDNQGARSAFSAALQQNTYRFIERPLARQFLTQLANSH